MSEAIAEVKEVFREIMLHVLECEDELILELNDPGLKEAVRKHFENLRSQLAKVYVRKLREEYEKEMKAFSERLDVAFLPSKLIPRPPRSRDRARTWIERLNSILENYEEAIRQLRKKAGQERIM